MPFKTRAGSGRTLQRRGDDSRVVGQRADDRVLVEKGQRGLPLCLASRQLAKRAEMECSVREGDFTGFFQHFTGVPPRQAEYTLQDTGPLDAAGVQHGLGPLVRLRPDVADLAEQIGDIRRMGSVRPWPIRRTKRFTLS